MERRQFLGSILLLTAGGVLKAIPVFPEGRKRKLRFAVASDGHYGQPDTAYEEYFRIIVDKINAAHAREQFDFYVINGDIIHDKKEFFPAAKNALDRLRPSYYVTRGNHDMIDSDGWQEIWHQPLYQEFSLGKNSFLLLDSSDEKGTYRCPDVDWVQQMLEKNRQQENVFIFMHINPAKLTQHGILCEPLLTVFDQFDNIRAVFNGHDHQEADLKMHGGLHYIFDGHLGGSWGVDYRGFRIVELLDNGDLLTYMMDPDQKKREDRLSPDHKVLN